MLGTSSPDTASSTCPTQSSAQLLGSSAKLGAQCPALGSRDHAQGVSQAVSRPQSQALGQYLWSSLGRRVQVLGAEPPEGGLHHSTAPSPGCSGLCWCRQGRARLFASLGVDRFVLTFSQLPFV